MNRKDRRAHEAMLRKLDKRRPPEKARPDGRPLYYDVTGETRRECYYCARAGLEIFFGPGEIVMNDPANPPEGAEPYSIHTISVGRLPDNAVIYNPGTNKCRNKDGSEVWQEDKPVEASDMTEDFKLKS